MRDPAPDDADDPDQLYAVLGVARDADAAAIKRAYRRLAISCHPDRNPGDARAELRFKGIARAFAVLSDARRRALFDEFGAASLRRGFDPARARGVRPGDDAARWFDGPTWAESVRAAADRPMGTAAAGDADGGDADDRDADDGPRGGADPYDGDGDGARPDEPSAGRRARSSVPAPLETTITLELFRAIRGGEVVLALDGASFRVRLPIGVRDGSVLRVPAAGPSGRDLRVVVNVRPRPRYSLEGDDLHVRVPVTVGEACAGARVRVPAPGGAVTVTVPAMSAHGSRVLVAGHGIAARAGRAAGDLVVHLDVVLPDRDTDETREAARALDRVGYTHDVRATLASK